MADEDYGGPQGVSKPISRKDWGAGQDRPEITGEVPDLPDEPKTVPLTIYIGTEKFIIGTATVLGRKVHAQIKPADGRQLERLVAEGLVTSMSIYFDKAGPAEATAVLPFQNEKTEPKPLLSPAQIEEVNKTGLLPENPYRRPFAGRPTIDNVPEGLPKLKGLRVTHEIVDEITNTEEPWEDKFPYGKA